MLASIKGRNSVANLRKTTIYNTNVDLVNDDVYTKFGPILTIHIQPARTPLCQSLSYHTVDNYERRPC